MNAAEIIVSCVFGVLALVVYSYALYREAYYKGFDNALKLVDKMHEEKQKYNKWLAAVEEEIET